MGSAEPELRPGPFGDYELVRRIAIGGMAEIFEARCLRPDAPAPLVVLKILLPQLAQDPEFVRMLRDEARIGQVLSHPNLVRLFEHGRVGSQTYLAMELVDGIPLSDLLRWCGNQGERLPVGISLFVIEQVLEALAYVHEATDPEGAPLHVVHRDVTPHNVLLSRRGEVRLGDFGIARSSVRNGRTRTGVIKGKLRYLAPEQVTASSIDARTDLYAVGLMLFEMVTGSPYLRGDTEIELLREAEAPPFRPPSLITDDAACIDDVARHALARFPEERYRNAHLFIEAIRHVRSQMGQRPVAEELASWVERGLSDPAATVARVSGVPELPPTPSRVSSPTVNVRPAAPLPDPPDTDSRTSASVTPREVPPARRSRGLWTVVVGLAALAAAILGGRAMMLRDEPHSVKASESPSPVAPASSTMPVPEPPATQQEASLAEANAAAPSSVALPARGVPSPRPTVRASAPADASAPASASVEPLTPPDAGPLPQEQALRQKLSAARGSLAQRGILLGDLTPDQRASLRSAEQALAAQDTDQAAALIASLEQSLAGLRVDGTFVRQKMSRVDAALQVARKQGEDVSSLQTLSAQALQAYMEGRYAQTNALLNVLLGRLAALRGSTPRQL